MPFGRRSEPQTAPADMREWRPQVPGKKSARSIVDPIIEPFWEGVHVLAFVAAGSATFVDDEGIDRTEEYEAQAAALRQTIDAEDAVVDGFLTVQMEVTAERERDLQEPPTFAEHTRRMILGGHTSDRLPMPKVPGADDDARFVAVDLLSIDGQTLLEVPLLERRRLLEGAITRTEIVSVTAYAQPPGETFRRSCRAMGFWALTYKGTNSRYVPGTHSADWAVFRIPAR